jgi:hypothetical protein
MESNWFISWSGLLAGIWDRD